MKIINPLYDKAFKYLMQNDRMAKKVLSVILDEEIEEVSLEPQETVFADEKRGLSLFRLDFKAVIVSPEGERQTVLIELQKSKFDTDIRRFRNYLGSAYLQSTGRKKTEEEPVYPLITVYILGYNLAEIPYLAVTVNQLTVNSIDKKPIEVNSFFINALTHRSHILQVRRLPTERRSRLEQFMTFFNQACISENSYILDLESEEIPEEFAEIARHLQGPVYDDSFRRQLDAEEELDLIFDRQEAKHLREKADLEKEKAEALAEKEAALEREEKARIEKEAALQKAEAAQNQAIDLQKKMAALLKAQGKSPEEIEQMTGFRPEEN